MTMQKARIFTLFALVLSILLPASLSAQYSTGGVELRPFDFTDDYYVKNGVNPKMILNRRTGVDKYSVIDFLDSDINRSVRITGTWPMDNFRGELGYVAPLGELPSDGFTKTEEGKVAISIAHRYPYFVFPSSNFKNKFRQADVAETGDGYFKKNPLGLSVIVSVEFTVKAASKEGQIEIESLLGKNGKTLDSTYAIRRVSEIDYLTRRGLVRQVFWNMEGKSGPAYKINHVFEDPTKGAISPDANLIMILEKGNKPLDSEKVFVEQFECLQKIGDWCGKIVNQNSL